MVERGRHSVLWRLFHPHHDTHDTPTSVSSIDSLDTPRIVVRQIVGGLVDADADMRLGSGASRIGGGGSSHFGADALDLVLPIVLVGIALFAADKTFHWRLGKYLPGFDTSPTVEAPQMKSNVGTPNGAARGTRQFGPGTSTGTADEPAPAVGQNRARTGQVDVVLDVEVNPDGTPGSIRVVRGAGGTADERAIEKARTMRFAPARKAGVAVPSHVEISVTVPLK